MKHIKQLQITPSFTHLPQAIGQAGKELLTKKLISRFHLAASLGNMDAMRRSLLSPLIDVNSTIESGPTALHFASRSGKIDAVDFLIKAGANVNATTSHGSPLHYGLQHLEIVKRLLAPDASANIEELGWNGMTPLIDVAHNAFPIEVLDVLIEHGANIHATDKYGLNSLQNAAAFEAPWGGINQRERDVLETTQLEIIQKLSKLVNVNELSNNANGDAAIHIAARHATPSGIKALLSIKGIEVDKLNKVGKTALMCATESGTRQCCADDVVRQLIEAKADSVIPDADGRLALEVAADNLPLAYNSHVATRLYAYLFNALSPHTQLQVV